MNNKNIIHLSNNQAECKISLFGGNLISYKPKSEKHDIFWLGDLNKFDNIQAIRGGIPVCWPRFAEEKLNNHFPRHGFARLSNWQIQNISVNEQKIEVSLYLPPNETYRAKISAILSLRITDTLEYSLETTNLSHEDFKFSEALHAYFNIGDRDKTIIKGLSGYRYQNSLDNKTYILEQDLTINNEFDGAFINHTNNIEIIDPIYNRTIIIEKHGSNSTIVWNPNRDLVEMSPGQYKSFVCIEPANQGNLFVTLPPQKKHTISMRIKIKH